MWGCVFVVWFALYMYYVFLERNKKCLFLIFCFLFKKKINSCSKKQLKLQVQRNHRKRNCIQPTVWVEIELSVLTSSATLMSLDIRIFIPTVPTISKTPCTACVKIHKNIPASRFRNCIQYGITAVSKMHLIGWRTYPNDDFVVEFVEQWFHWYNNLKTYTANIYVINKLKHKHT